RDRQHRDLQNGLRLRDGQTLRIPGGTDVGRQRITRAHRIVDDRASLDALRRPRATLGIWVVGGIAVVRRIRVDDAADRTVLISKLRLQTPPALAVTRHHDPALDADAVALERLVIIRHAIVDVDE